VHDVEEGVGSIVPDGSGVDWDGPHGLERLATVAWRTIPRPSPETFCTRADPFC
jgi:hypothetical protein